MKLTLELYGKKITAEENGDGHTAQQLKELFSRLLVVAGYSPSVIEDQDGGRYEYLEDDEIVIKSPESKE